MYHVWCHGKITCCETFHGFGTHVNSLFTKFTERNDSFSQTSAVNTFLWQERIVINYGRLSRNVQALKSSWYPSSMIQFFATPHCSRHSETTYDCAKKCLRFQKESDKHTWNSFHWTKVTEFWHFLPSSETVIVAKDIWARGAEYILRAQQYACTKGFHTFHKDSDELTVREKNPEFCDPTF